MRVEERFDTTWCSDCWRSVPRDHTHEPPHGFKASSPGHTYVLGQGFVDYGCTITCYCGHDVNELSARLADQQMRNHLEANR